MCPSRYRSHPSSGRTSRPADRPNHVSASGRVLPRLRGRTRPLILAISLSLRFPPQDSQRVLSRRIRPLFSVLWLQTLDCRAVKRSWSSSSISPMAPRNSWTVWLNTSGASMQQMPDTGDADEQWAPPLRASGIAHRRTEEERAEALFLCERRRRWRIHCAMREHWENIAPSTGL